MVLLRSRRLVAALPALALVVLAPLAGGPAAGAVYTITTLEDGVVDDGNCTLREALLAASTDSTSDQCAGDVEPDTIVLAAVGTYVFAGGAISSAARELTVRGAPGQPASAYVVDLGGTNRFLAVGFDSDLTLENLTLFDGLGGAHGGALLAEDSDLALREVTITDSEAQNGGAVAFRAFAEHHLEIVGSTFSANRATGDQADGGAVEVNLQAGGNVRILATQFLDNRIDAAAGSFGRRGGGLSLRSFAGGAIELRHLDFERNVISAPSFASGAGARLSITASESFVLEDARFVENEHAIEVGTNSAAGLDLTVDAPAASVRRLRLLGNLPGVGRDQAVIQVTGATQAVVSDLLVAGGEAIGLFLATSGATCSLVAGNLTVADHPETGLRLAEGSCPLRVENSIVFGNGTVSGTNLQLFSGSPEVSPETLVGVDPQFVDAPGGDYRLGPASLAAEAGDATFASVGPFDAAHGPRLAASELDLGALERGALFGDDFERGEAFAWSLVVGAAPAP